MATPQLIRCRHCGLEIEREKAVKHPEKQKYYFCNEEHLQLFSENQEEKLKPNSLKKKRVKSKPKLTPDEKVNYTNLTDYLQNLYGEEANWPLLTMQIKRMVDDFDFKYTGILLTLKYCYETLQFNIDKRYGIEKVVTAFYQSAKEHWGKNRRIQELCKDFNEDRVKVVKSYPKPSKKANRVIKLE